MEILENKVIITETIEKSFSYEELEAKIQNLNSEKRRLNQIITVSNAQISQADEELKKFESLLTEASDKGLVKAKIDESAAATIASDI